MSLDVSLYTKNKCPHCKEVLESDVCVYDANITHNLGQMAQQAGIYMHLWRPDELELINAHQMIKPLKEGLRKLKADPRFYESFNSPNGWGLYEHFVPFVEDYLSACEEYPEAEILISR